VDLVEGMLWRWRRGHHAQFFAGGGHVISVSGRGEGGRRGRGSCGRRG
jgi:hypothetical protein